LRDKQKNKIKARKNRVFEMGIDSKVVQTTTNEWKRRSAELTAELIFFPIANDSEYPDLVLVPQPTLQDTP